MSNHEQATAPKDDSVGRRAVFALLENGCWVLARLLLALLLFLLATLFEGELKGLFTAKSIAELKNKEIEQLEKEHQSYSRLEISISKVRNALADSSAAIEDYVGNHLQVGQARAQNKIKRATATLVHLQGLYGSRDVILSAESERLLSEFLRHCEKAIEMHNMILKNTGSLDIGRMRAIDGVIQKVAENIAMELKSERSRIVNRSNSYAGP